MKLKKIISVSAALLMLCSSFTACSATDGGQASEGGSEISETASAEEILPETEEEWHEAMIKKSLTSYGNTSKMKEKLEAAMNGEELNISYLGGSITEGVGASDETCWAYLTYQHITEKFGTGDNVNYNNAGLSGTPSKLGILRLQRDVLNYDPDICFVEFAVNDGSESDYQNAYESIIRTLIENDVAVVLVFAVTEEGHSCQDYFMQSQGEYYDLPMISYRDAITYMFDNGQMTWSDFSDDQSHPNTYGHSLVAEMVNNYFDTVMDQEAQEYVYPESSINSVPQYGAELYENDSLSPDSEGSWSEGSTINSFTNGWCHKADAGENEPIVFNITAKRIYLIYHTNSYGNLGTAHFEIYADGELTGEYDINGITSGGWGNPETFNLILGTELKDYEIRVTMSEGCEENYFEILGFGVIC